MNRNNRITPEWIECLKENEIFVFGCRNSGRHWDGASAFALKHFGAVFGQREGRQGQSYAIPTIGGVIELKEIRQSVETFTQYAAEHPELHFLVTPIGCGGGGWSPAIIAPLFRRASKLPNVSLPRDFWNRLQEPKLAVLRKKAKELKDKVANDFRRHQGDLLHRWMKRISPERLYCFLMKGKRYGQGLPPCETSWEEVDLKENISWIAPFVKYYPPSRHTRFLLNHDTRRAYIIVDDKQRLLFVHMEDIDWDSVNGVPAEVKIRIEGREARYTFGIYEYHDGLARVMWQVSPDGSTHYLDKHDEGKTTDEKDIRLWGVIDTECRFVEKLHLVSETE